MDKNLAAFAHPLSLREVLSDARIPHPFRPVLVDV